MKTGNLILLLLLAMSAQAQDPTVHDHPVVDPPVTEPPIEEPPIEEPPVLEPPVPVPPEPVVCPECPAPPEPVACPPPPVCMPVPSCPPPVVCPVTPPPPPPPPPVPDCVQKPVKVTGPADWKGFAYWSLAGRGGTFGTPADTQNNRTRSKLRLFEDAKEIGPPHSNHKDIARIGKGRFAHYANVNGTGESIRFAASDNSSPLKNGKAYTYCVGK